MTDRELLEKAARAAGYKIQRWSKSGAAEIEDSVWWSPLEEDGDALRLAISMKRSLYICIEAENAGVVEIQWDFDEGGFARQSIEQEAPLGGDDYAATRRAIVRAAAAIGETL